MKKCLFLLLPFLIATLAEFVKGEEIPVLELKVTCATFEEDGTPIVQAVTIPLDGNPDASHSFGTGTLHTGAPHGLEYTTGYTFVGPNPGLQTNFAPFTTYEIDMNWEVIDRAHIIRLLRHGDNKAWWDWYYDGYGRPAACDYTRNCHGYTFGHQSVIAATPFFYRDDYVAAPKDQAEVAVSNDGFTHSMKCSGKMCQWEESRPFIENGIECLTDTLAPPPLDSGLPGAPGSISSCDYGIHTSSSEQFLESGTYTQMNGTCLNPINLKKAHYRSHTAALRDHDGNPVQYSEFDHNLFKRRSP